MSYLLLLLIASVSSYPSRGDRFYAVEPQFEAEDTLDYTDALYPTLDEQENQDLPYGYFEGQDDFSDIPTAADSVVDGLLEESLPWYSEQTESEDENPGGWSVVQDTPVGNQETLLDLDTLGENYIQSSLNLQREKNRKRSDEMIEKYNLVKNPFISTRKNFLATQEENKTKKSITPKKHEQTRVKMAAESQLLPAKRGMPEVPIYRPYEASDPVLSQQQLPGQAGSPHQQRSKRSARKPTPFFGRLQPSPAKQA